jgi:hypothetical protein
MYSNGYGVEQNKAKAFSLYLKSANGGEITSQYNVANMYYNGIGVNKDLKQSANWFKKAADNGDADSQFRYGSALHKGEGVKKDPAQAYKYFKMSALNGNISAQHAVGLYLTDLEYFPNVRLVEKNKSFFNAKDMSLRWLKLASDAGSQSALDRLHELEARDKSLKRLGDMIGKAQTGISSNDDETYARSGVYRREDQRKTKYGDIGVLNEKDKSLFIYKDAPLIPSIQAKNRVRIDEVIELNNKIYILVMVDDGEKGCYGNFRWITLLGANVNTTDVFGNCSGIADIVIKDGKFEMTMPKYKDKKRESFTFNG